VFVKKNFPSTGIVSNVLLLFFDQKQLYKFFDREGIFLTTEIIGSEAQWVYSINSNGVTIGFSESKTTREEIEVVGFYKCFEYLEKKLGE
jgi:hypothetical protein